MRTSISGQTARAWGSVSPGRILNCVASGEAEMISARAPGPLVITSGRPASSGLARSSAYKGRSGTNKQAIRIAIRIPVRMDLRVGRSSRFEEVGAFLR